MVSPAEQEEPLRSLGLSAPAATPPPTQPPPRGAAGVLRTASGLLQDTMERGRTPRVRSTGLFLKYLGSACSSTKHNSISGKMRRILAGAVGEAEDSHRCFEERKRAEIGCASRRAADGPPSEDLANAAALEWR